MGPKSGWGGPVGIGYVRPVQFLDHLTVITIEIGETGKTREKREKTKKEKEILAMF